MLKNKLYLLTLLLILTFSGCAKGSAPNLPENEIDPPQMNNSKTSNDTSAAAGRVLDLSNRSLERLSQDIFKNTAITELDVSGNKLTGALPGEIRFLKNLKVLNTSDNLMTGIPAEIGQLSDLEILNYANNDITGLPLEIGNLKKLKILNLSGNNFSEYDLDLILKQLPNLQIIK